MSCFTKDKRKVLFLSLLAAKHFAMQSSAMYCSWHRCVKEQVNERPIEKIKKQTKKTTTCDRAVLACFWLIQIQMFFLHTPWHCDFTVLGGHMLRLLPYTVLSSHPAETNGMLDPGPFHLFLQIPFSHPFNFDGSFHTTVCTLPWQDNEHQSVALFHTQTFIW